MLFLQTRGVYITGYDRAGIQKDNKKYLLKGLEKYGIDPNTVYIGKFNYYLKDLLAKAGYYIAPNNMKYATADPQCMGFNPPSLITVGFHITASTSEVETGLIQLFYVVCDAAGISWNRNVPCEPEKLTWLFSYVEE